MLKFHVEEKEKAAKAELEAKKGKKLTGRQHVIISGQPVTEENLERNQRALDERNKVIAEKKKAEKKKQQAAARALRASQRGTGRGRGHGRGRGQGSTAVRRTHCVEEIP